MIRILAVSNKKYPNHVFYVLKKWDYEIKVVGTLIECREVLSSNEFDIVLFRLEPDEEWPPILRLIKQGHPDWPIIGLTTLSKRQLNRLLDSQDISRVDFINVFYQPLKLEDIVFAIEEIIARFQEETIEEEKGKPLTKQERQQQLAARRSLLENQRLNSFLSTYTEPNNF